MGVLGSGSIAKYISHFWTKGPLALKRITWFNLYEKTHFTLLKTQVRDICIK